MQQHIRPPAVAGMFYPSPPEDLRQMVEGFLAEATPSSFSEAPKALIAPHAGYIYSGPVAASAYAALVPARHIIHRVILLGPSHRVPFRGLALSSADSFATPLGNIPLDQQAILAIRDLPQVQLLDQAHAMEHSLEVHLPFLQTVLAEFTLVPLVVGDATPEEISEVLEILWGGRETLIMVSSDLSHYHDYSTAVREDQATSRAILALQDRLRPEQACGCRAINGLLHLAKSRNLHVSMLDLRNSGDTAGPRDRVVGYGAYAVS
jgi:hypothetical protein